MKNNFYVILLHDKMHDKSGKIVTTSLTMIDLHDIARSSATFGVKNLFIAHPAPSIRKLARTLKSHWETGYGSTYNPNRKEALEHAQIVTDLDEAIHKIDSIHGRLPKIIATSAKKGPGRIPYQEMRETLQKDPECPYLLMFGTGWGMCDELLARADLFLEPVLGPGGV
jgi:hypothetical protein